MSITVAWCHLLYPSSLRNPSRVGKLYNPIKARWRVHTGIQGSESAYMHPESNLPRELLSSQQCLDAVPTGTVASGSTVAERYFLCILANVLAESVRQPIDTFVSICTLTTSSPRTTSGRRMPQVIVVNLYLKPQGLSPAVRGWYLQHC